MNKYICFLSVVALCSLSAAECSHGYESGKVLKVLKAPPGVSTPARADEERPSRTASAQFVIFAAHGNQYSLRLPPGSAGQALSPAAGDQVCFRKEGTVIRVRTGDGKLLPGVAHPIRETPQTQ